MTDSDGRYHSAPVRGDVFVDTTLGAGVAILSLVGLGTAIYRVLRPDPHYAFEPPVPVAPGGEAARIALILFAIAGGIALMRAGRRAMSIAFAIFALRLVVDFAFIPSVGIRDRFLSMQLFFDAAMVAYCWLRIRALGRRAAQ